VRAGLTAVAARAVTHRDLMDAVAGAAGAGQDLGVHEGAERGDRHGFDDVAPEDLERAVDVAHAQVEEQVHHSPPQPCDDAPAHGIAARRAIARHHVEAVGVGEELRELGEVELEIRIAEEDQLTPRLAQARTQRRAVAAIRGVAHQAQPLALAALHQLGGAIAAAVVHHDHLEVGLEPRRERHHRVEEHLDVSLFVEGREHEGESRRRQESGRALGRRQGREAHSRYPSARRRARTRSSSAAP
jgi:hypothetical protein